MPIEEPSMALLACGNSNRSKSREATVKAKVDEEKMSKENAKIDNNTDIVVKDKRVEAVETPRMASKRRYVDDSDEDFREEEPDEDSDDDEVALKEEKPAAENKGAVKKRNIGKGKSAPPPSVPAPEFATSSVVLGPGIERLAGNLMYHGPPHEPQTLVPAGTELQVISPENFTLMRKAHDKICRDYGIQPKIPADLWDLISKNPANHPIVTNWGVFFICSKETKHDNPIYKPWWHFYFDPVTGKKSTSCIKHEKKAPSWFVLADHLAARGITGTPPPQ